MCTDDQRDQKIKLLTQQIKKLTDPNLNSSIWLNETSHIIYNVFGKSSYEYGFISRFRFERKGAEFWDEPEVIKIRNADEEARSFMKSCIESLEHKDMSRETENAIGQKLRYSLEQWGVIVGLGTVIFSVGFFVGKYSSDLQNVEYKREVKALRDSLSVRTPLLTNPETATDTTTKKELKNRN